MHLLMLCTAFWGDSTIASLFYYRDLSKQVLSQFDGILRSQLAYDFARHSCSNHSGGDVLCHDASAAYDRVVTDSYSAVDDYAARQPNVVADSYRAGVFKVVIAVGILLNSAFFWEQRMHGRSYCDVGTEHDVVSDCHRRDVENDAVVIGVEVFAY